MGPVSQPSSLSLVQLQTVHVDAVIDERLGLSMYTHMKQSVQGCREKKESKIIKWFMSLISTSASLLMKWQNSLLLADAVVNMWQRGVCVLVYTDVFLWYRERKECSQWNCYWLWPMDPLSWHCSSLIQPVNQCLFMAAERYHEWRLMLVLLAKCFTIEGAGNREKAIIINGLHYRAGLLLSCQFTGIMRQPLGLSVWFLGRWMWRVKRTRFVEVDSSKWD